MNIQMILGFIQDLPRHAAIIVYIMTFIIAWLGQATWFEFSKQRYARHEQPSQAELYLYTIYAEPNSMLPHALSWMSVSAFYALRFSGTYPV